MTSEELCMNLLKHSIFSDHTKDIKISVIKENISFFFGEDMVENCVAKFRDDAMNSMVKE